MLERPMELRHLRYFVAAAEMENVSRAALKLHVSQPTLSTQIRDIEDELGFTLFERTGKSVRLTDMGFLLRSLLFHFFIMHRAMGVHYRLVVRPPDHCSSSGISVLYGKMCLHSLLSVGDQRRTVHVF